MKNQDTKRAEALKFELPERLLRSLHIGVFPTSDTKGRWTLGPNPNTDDKGRPQPYEFLLDNQESPKGFGIFVGARGASYRVRRRFGDKFIKFQVCMVSDMPLSDAQAQARAMWQEVETTQGRNPKVVAREKRAQMVLRTATVKDALNRYLEHLKTRSEKAKPASLNSVQDSLARLERPEVGLANREIRTLTRQMLQKAWIAVRTEAMRRSSYVPNELKDRLLDSAEIKKAIGQEKAWHELTNDDLIKFGLKEKMRARVLASGLSATEHTFSDASRGVRLLIQDEERASAREDRKPELRFNPFEELEDNHRSQRQLNKHYNDAKVRNPLKEEDESLRNVLKAIVARRLEQGGQNKTASDYLMLTLLWGARRNETAQLRWYPCCHPDELNTLSWVWLTENEEEVNPFTKKKGSQVYFHDTKNGSSQLVPICYFAKRILAQRWADREVLLSKSPERIRSAEEAMRALESIGADKNKLEMLERVLKLERAREANQIHVFPARNTKAKKGYYSDSKSILKNIRTDAGLLDMAREIDVGLTPHDFRRTLGAFASTLLNGPMVSKLLNHRVKEDGVSPIDKIYTEQEWTKLREGLGQVEEAILRQSPRVWNILKGTDKPVLDEVNDPSITIFKSNKTADIMEGKVGFGGETTEGGQEMDSDE